MARVNGVSELWKNLNFNIMDKKLLCCVCGNEGKMLPFGFVLCKEHDTELSESFEYVNTHREDDDIEI